MQATWKSKHRENKNGQMNKDTVDDHPNVQVHHLPETGYKTIGCDKTAVAAQFDWHMFANWHAKSGHAPPLHHRF
ncbi:hypothetical protein [Vibrio rumoiensis]|uniref:hypothetical protein n=1 Tax=Vibrio rumoiensis TaxID=76258 RepID=UPI003AA9292B